MPSENQVPSQQNKAVAEKEAAVQGSAPNVKLKGRQVVHHQELFIGPVPSPAVLAEYDRVKPGLAERIVRMAEEEQAGKLQAEHRESDRKDRLLVMAENESRHFISAQRLGQWAGLLVTLLCVLGAITMAYRGADWKIVAALISLPTASLIAAFIPKDKPGDTGSGSGGTQILDKSKDKG